MNSANYRGKQAEKSHSKQYLILGIVIALIVGALIVWSHLPQHPNVDAVKIGEETYRSNEVEYFYMQAYNNTWQMAKMYEQYGMSSGYDTTKAPKDQMYDEKSQKTYADFFRETAVSQLQQVALLKNQAKDANYKLSDEGKASVDAQMKSIESQILQLVVTKGGSEKYYLTAMYGPNMTKSQLRTIIEDLTLADEFTKHYKEGLTFEPAQLDTYYQENVAALDSYDFRTFFVAATPESGVDESGKPIDPTEEQIAAAMKIARATADDMAKAVKRGADFNTAAQQVAPEADKAKYTEDSSTLTMDAQGSSLTSSYGEWLKDASRKAGQVDVIEQSGSGYYVVQFLTREKRDNSFETADVSSILVKAETTETTDDAGKKTSAPTQDQLATAKGTAVEILAQYQSGSDKSSEAFLALAPAEKSELISTVSDKKLVRNTYGKTFDQWAFAPGATQIGDVQIVEVTDDAGTAVGYRIALLNGFGQSRWQFATLTALQNENYSVWLETQKEKYSITELDGLKQVGN